jgi:hypothetical protein
MDRRTRAAFVVSIIAIALVAASCGTKGSDGHTASKVPPLTNVVSSSTAAAKEHGPTPAVSCLNASACGHSVPPPSVPPCPPHQAQPSFNGSYCGPKPSAGNGFGSSGECTGRETAPPCGPGMIVGRYYLYTLPGQCDGRLILNGRHWLSELPPPTRVPDIYVWVSIGTGGRAAGFISPNGSVGFDLDHGQPASVCSTVP